MAGDQILHRVSVWMVVCLFSVAAQAKYSGGSGTKTIPYRIATAADLLLLGDSPEDYGKHFLLIADIDLDPDLPGCRIFDKAVIASSEAIPFKGSLNGQARVVSHLVIKGGSYAGLFGGLGSGAEIKDLGVVDVNIAGSGDYIGGLVGKNLGRVTRCYSTGQVRGSAHIGGLVGANAGTVSQGYSSGVVVGVEWIGGLVGWNFMGTVTQCYSIGAVIGDSGVGGLIGWNEYSTVTQCYSSGHLSGKDIVRGLLVDGGGSVITACFWDTQASHQDRSDGGKGKSTAGMQTAKTFVDAGWDFVGETANGTNDIWWIDEGRGSPRLWWELKRPGLHRTVD